MPLKGMNGVPLSRRGLYPVELRAQLEGSRGGQVIKLGPSWHHLGDIRTLGGISLANLCMTGELPAQFCG